tara:strand:- start:13062 stop:13409 length:348 start_codon:yes stop_codon:yes gene_type:complete
MRVTVLIIAFALLGLAVVGAAYAHDAPMGWRYDIFCCNGDNHTGDCQPIPASTVQVTSTGYKITLKPGDHRLVTVPHTFTIDFAKAKKSQDGEFHACLYPTEDTLRCFYAPPMSF